MSSYRAIFFDLDGTAIPNRPDGMPSATLIEVVARSKHLIHLIPTSGRTIVQALPVIRSLGLGGLSILGGGTIIFDNAAEKVIKRTTIPADAVRAVMKLSTRYPRYPLYIREEQIGEAHHENHPIVDDCEIMMMINVMDSDLADITRELSRIGAITASTSLSWQVGSAVTVTHKDSTKEHAVTDVLRRLNVPREAAIGIGDGNNDLHLFRSVGLKIAMGNASPELKAAADLTCGTIDEDGLAETIKRYA